MKTSDVFKKGNHNIGYLSSDFLGRMPETFELVSEAPIFQKLTRSMSDKEILAELKPGECTLGDVLALIENPQEETKNGYSNIFYIKDSAFVGSVHWSDDEWYVDAWSRSDGRWCDVNRVFSPGHSHPLTYEERK